MAQGFSRDQLCILMNKTYVSTHARMLLSTHTLKYIFFFSSKGIEQTPSFLSFLIKRWGFPTKHPWNIRNQKYTQLSSDEAFRTCFCFKNPSQSIKLVPLTLQNTKMENIWDYFPVQPLLMYGQEYDGGRKTSIHVSVLAGYIDPSFTAAE